MAPQRNLYGLLVGIDDYPSPVPKLRGCLNDVTAFADYLRGRADGEAFSEPDLLILRDQAATREAVIKGFREHLSQAGKDDVALFYYSGHGAQAHSPKEFWHLEPDKLDETLVCYDSREEGNYDLADKELAHLIAEVAEKEPHITVILDCCHSGSGTRGPLETTDETRVRLAATDERDRPVASYLFDDKTLKALEHASESGWFALPAGRHVLLAACQPSELAKEIADEEKHRGAFSYALLTTLETANQPLSYLDVRERSRLRVWGRVADQLPLLEVSRGNPDAVKETFLGGATAKPVQFTASHDGKTWLLNAGTLHGIPKPSGEETATVALFPEDAQAEALRDPDKALTEAKVTKALSQTSWLEPAEEGKLEPEKLYQAVIVDLPLKKLPVKFEGEEAGVGTARQALSIAADGKPSLFVAEEETNPEYRLIAQSDGYIVARAADDRPLLEKISGPTLEDAAKEALGQLEHVARWKAASLLENPDTKLAPDAVKIIVRYDDKTLEDESFTLRYGANGDEPSFYLDLENTTNKRLYCGLVALFESYQILPVFQDWLEPGQTFTLNDGESVSASVPDDLWERGVTERKDIFKLIVSKEPFDPYRLQQGPLEEYRGDRGLTTRGALGALERLMQKVTTRESWGGKSSHYDDWTTKSITLTTVRPRQGEQIPSEGRGLALYEGVTLEPHPSLRASARLSTLGEVSRDLRGSAYSNFVVPEILRQDPSISQPLQFTSARGQDPGLSVLELADVENHAAVTKETPLKLTLEVGLEPGEAILPLAFDGEHYLPLGYSQAVESAARGEAGGRTQVVLERLPDPETPNVKSLFGSLRILFQKFKADLLGGTFEYPVLAVAEVGDDGSVLYHRDSSEVRTKVQAAERVLLFVHGIIGDTSGLAPSVQLAKVSKDGQELPLKAHYDLVLTFDYESINTSIKENAQLLKERLTAVGLGENHGKTLDVVAHSMGGLVSRWFIEQLGGNKVVSRLVMVGTPNAGSPWPQVQDWATTMLGVGLNGLSRFHWSAAVIAKLVTLAGTALEKVDTALDEMNPASEFFKDLAKSQDPKLSYTILAGNTSILADDETKRLLGKLKLRGYAALTRFLFKEDNDIAVAVASIQQLDAKRHPKPTTVVVASDHVSYFHTDDALKQLAKALG